MPFRVTSNQSIAQALQAAQRHGADVSRLQGQISSGLRVQRPSDDPAGMRALLARQAESSRRTSDLSNLAAVRNSLSVSFTHLQDAQRLFVEAKQSALQVRQVPELDDPRVFIDETNRLLERLIAIANARQDGEYVFAGDAVTTEPFVIDGESLTGTGSVAYVGGGARGRTTVGEGLFADRIYSGREVFQPRTREATLFLGPTGAAAGTSISSAVGSGELLVRHTLTSYAAGSGVQPGTSSAGGDTVIGPAGAHVLTVNDASGTGASGTVSLNGGPPVAFTSGDADLQVAGPQGEVVFVDTTAVTPGFSGTVDLTANGTLSVDGGVTETAIDFSGNQAVPHGETQAVTYVDGSNIRRAGVDTIEYRGTADAFQVLIDLRETLRDAGELPAAEWQAALDRRIADIDRIHEHLLSVVGEQSLTLETLDRLEDRSRTLQLETDRQASEIAAADISTAAIQLQQAQSLLQFTFAAAAQLHNQSLLDFLR